MRAVIIGTSEDIFNAVAFVAVMFQIYEFAAASEIDWTEEESIAVIASKRKVNFLKNGRYKLALYHGHLKINNIQKQNHTMIMLDHILCTRWHSVAHPLVVQDSKNDEE